MEEDPKAGAKLGCPSIELGPPHAPYVHYQTPQTPSKQETHHEFKSGIKPSDFSTQSQDGVSCWSMRTDHSKDVPIIFSGEARPSDFSSRSQDGVSFRSMRTDRSKDVPIIFSGEPGPLDFSSRSQDGVSCWSMRTDRSKDVPIIFSGEPGPLDSPKEPGHLHSMSELSCLSWKSKDLPIIFSNEPSDLQFQPEPEDASGQCSQTQLDTIFMRLTKHIVSFVNKELKKFHRILGSDNPECLTNEDDEEQKSSEAFLTIALEFLRRMNQEALANKLQKKCNSRVRRKLKSSLQQRYQCVFEGLAEEGNPTLLNQIYTELYITEGGPGGVNNEHEVRHIESISRKSATPENTITCKDIFKGFGQRKAPVRTVLTKGVAGIGKTVLTQKFSLDWAEGRTNQEIQLLFPFTFRELNLLSDRQFSLMGLVQHFFSDAAGLRRFEDLDVVFIFDGLDEWRIPLDFTTTRALCDVTESASVDVLLVNLIKGTLLPSAHLWITTRPAAANQIPAKCVSMVTEVRGFTDLQKDEYFSKKYENRETAIAIISHIKRSQSLYIMCHIPVFCWIIATVLQHVIESMDRDQLPQTLTEIYIYFLVVQTKVSIKYDKRSESDPLWSPETRKMVESLGKVAFKQLQKRNIIFYESDLIDCGLDPTTAAVYSGVFTQVFRRETNLYQDKVYCFVHLSVQEFLAALHVHHTFFNFGVNLLTKEQQLERFGPIMRRLSLWLGFAEANFYQSAVDLTLQNQNGDYDLFLRFLMGLSLPANQNLLHGLLTRAGNSAKSNQKTVKYIQEKINRDLSAERTLNLFHCLNELNDHALINEIQQYLRTGHLDGVSPGLWSALAFLLLSSRKNLTTFDLKEYCASEVALLRLLPVIKVSNNAVLSGCNLSERSCAGLASVLSSQFSSLSLLDLSNNDLQDCGVEQLCSGLKSSFCRLETLSLSYCNLTEESCGHLSSVLSSQSSGLKTLNLGNNLLQDSGAVLLCSGLKSPLCRLETLRLSGCLISKQGGASLASALSSAPSSCLRELDVSYNDPGPSAVGHLRALCKDQQRPLELLRVEPAGVEWLTPGLKKYFRKLILDPNATEKGLLLSEGSSTVRHQNARISPLVPVYLQTLCSSGLTGRCYWEVVWNAEQLIVALSYRAFTEGEFGQHGQSWTLKIIKGDYFACHNKIQTPVSSSSPGAQVKNVTSHQHERSGILGIYLDHEAGSLSFYKASTGKLLHLHTFNATFTEPLFAGFGLWPGTCLSLLELRHAVGIVAPPGGFTVVQIHP